MFQHKICCFLWEWPFSVNLLLPRCGFILDHSSIGWTIIARRLSGCGSASVCGVMSGVTEPSHLAPLTMIDPRPDLWCDLSPVMTPHELWMTSQHHNILAIKSQPILLITTMHGHWAGSWYELTISMSHSEPWYSLVKIKIMDGTKKVTYHTTSRDGVYQSKVVLDVQNQKLQKQVQWDVRFSGVEVIGDLSSLAKEVRNVLWLFTPASLRRVDFSFNECSYPNTLRKDSFSSTGTHNEHFQSTQ